MTKIIINVGRQIGSGGHIIAEKLAKDFGCKCYDRELLNLAAKESGFSEKFFEQNDEQKGFFKSLFKNVINIFITANIDDRIKAVCKRKNIDRAAARKFIESHEEQRASYYDYYTGKKWGHSESYDLCINSSHLGIEETEKFIAEFIRKKFNL